ncbi:DUF2268 domain-containing protein [Deinococcus yavapaiensis]|uniref:Uncharacterized protein YjaZ n=1 Tax=Deinococcus yavapaiensis KR-236 TaxID=694435 RepID=A0A318S9P6_9DEIO|nr:DUF2268 domain-containing putative Zn-dependent protease [Deinococcus yavapaiensis]PYE55941.1 uncharacterized protein YjaZ [Deinococcus yavapaiensis KR-236]
METTLNMRTVKALDGLRKALEAPKDERDGTFVREVMEPLRPLWEPSLRFMGSMARDVTEPLDVARLFRFYRPELGAERGLTALAELERAGTWAACVSAFQEAMDALDPVGHGLRLPGANMSFVLADPDGMDARLGSYTGVGNVPGWSLLLAWPTEFNLPRLPAIVTHEFHHNVRFAFEPPWPMTLGQYLVAEGLAEAFAAHFHGEEKLGHWTTGLSEAEVRAVRPRFAQALLSQDWNVVRGFIFGDWAASEHQFEAQGVPDFAGYAMGYRMVREALRRSGWSVVEATYRPWREIVAASGWFDEVLADAAVR